jgi:protease IV
MEYVRESIFKSSIRVFFKAFFIILGVFIAFIPISIAIGLISQDPGELDEYKVEILPDLNGQQKYLPLTTPAILRIDIHGVIGKKNLCTDDLSQLLIESRRGFLKDNRVKGILLHIKSPGGSVNDSDGIYRLVQAYKEKYKVPVYTYIDGLCASGGMYIASSSDKILANPVSIVGSVGVIVGPFFNVVNGMEKVGINSLTVTQGKGKDNLSPFKKWTDNEDQSLENISAYLYNRFVNIVVQARPNINRDTLIEEYGANIFGSKQAKENGYIDEDNASYQDALVQLLQAANIDTSSPYQIVRLEQKQDWLKYLGDNKAKLFNKKISHTVQIGPYDLSDLSDPFAYLYLPGIKGS